MTKVEELQALNDKLDTKVYFMGIDLEHGRNCRHEYDDMKVQRNSNNNLLEFKSNDPEEIEEHLADLQTAISDTKELLNT